MTGAVYSRLVELRRVLRAAHVKAQVIRDGCGDEAASELMEAAADKIGEALQLAGHASALAEDALHHQPEDAA